MVLKFLIHPIFSHFRSLNIPSKHCPVCAGKQLALFPDIYENLLNDIFRIAMPVGIFQHGQIHMMEYCLKTRGEACSSPFAMRENSSFSSYLSLVDNMLFYFPRMQTISKFHKKIIWTLII
jgi:hypothetical protein